MKQSDIMLMHPVIGKKFLKMTLQLQQLQINTVVLKKKISEKIGEIQNWLIRFTGINVTTDELKKLPVFNLDALRERANKINALQAIIDKIGVEEKKAIASLEEHLTYISSLTQVFNDSSIYLKENRNNMHLCRTKMDQLETSLSEAFSSYKIINDIHQEHIKKLNEAIKIYSTLVE